MLDFRRLSNTLALTALIVSAPGCHHYHVTAPRPDPAIEYKKRTIVSFWLFTENKLQTDCEQSNALDEVWVQSNLGYSLVNIATHEPYSNFCQGTPVTRHAPRREAEAALRAVLRAGVFLSVRWRSCHAALSQVSPLSAGPVKIEVGGGLGVVCGFVLELT